MTNSPYGNIVLSFLLIQASVDLHMVIILGKLERSLKKKTHVTCTCTFAE